MNAPAARHVRVPAKRLMRWCENFAASHGAPRIAVAGGELRLDAPDGSSARLRAPFGRSLAGVAPAEDELKALIGFCIPPEDWAVLLVRKGGFAIARLQGTEVIARKSGQRHVQGRTKAGGQSQQRFARRRDNQARVAYEAAAGHAVDYLLQPPVPILVTGGDRKAVTAVLEDPRLAVLRSAVVGDWLDAPNPRGAVLDAALRDACAPTIEVTNA